MLAVIATIPVYVILGIIAVLIGLLSFFLHKRNKKHLNGVKRVNKKAFKRLNKGNERRVQTRWRGRKKSTGRVDTARFWSRPESGKPPAKKPTGRPASKPASVGICKAKTTKGHGCMRDNAPGKDHCWQHPGTPKVGGYKPPAAPKQRATATKKTARPKPSSSVVHTDERIEKHPPVKRPPGFSDSDWNNATEAQRRYAVTGEGREAAVRDTRNQAWNSFFGRRS